MPSFDVVSTVDAQELRNAVDQTARELATRYDFRGTDASVELGEGTVTVEADTEGRLDAANDVLQSKLVRRGVDLRSLTASDPQAIGGGRVRTTWTVAEGIDKEAAKDLSKQIRDLGLKVQAQVQGDQLRVTGKKRDDLQQAIAAIKESDLDYEFEFTNFRD